MFINRCVHLYLGMRGPEINFIIEYLSLLPSNLFSFWAGFLTESTAQHFSKTGWARET